MLAQHTTLQFTSFSLHTNRCARQNGKIHTSKKPELRHQLVLSSYHSIDVCMFRIKSVVLVHWQHFRIRMKFWLDICVCVCIERCLQFCVMYICCRNTQRKDTGFGRKQIATQTLPTTELFKRHEKFALEHHAYTFRSLLLAFVSMLLTLNWMGFACIYMWWWWSKRFAIFFLYTWITNAHISITLNLSRFLVCVLGLVVGVILIQQHLNRELMKSQQQQQQR